METSCQTTPDLIAVRSTQAVRIGIVEDQAGVAESLKKLINRADGFQVVGTYPNGEAALEQIPGHKPDLVLMDIGLPGISGIECVRSLKALLPSLPIIMLTVYDDGEHLFDSQILSQAEAAFSSPRGFLHWVGEQVRFLSFAHAAGLIFTAPVPFELLEIHHNSRLVRVA